MHRATDSRRQIVKVADSKGHVTLGRQFANATVILSPSDPGQVLVTKARAISEHELDLLSRPEVLQGLLEGLRQSERGEYVANPPDIQADLRRAEKALRDINRARKRRRGK